MACVDADAGGGGLDVVFGMDHLPGIRWPDVLGAHGEVAPELLLQELPTENGVWVLSHSRDAAVSVPEEAERTVMRALRRGTDLVLLDAGRVRPLSASHRGGDREGKEPDFSGMRSEPGGLDGRSWEFADDVVLVVGATPQSLAAATVIVGALPEFGPRWWVAQRTPRSAEHLPETVQAALGVTVVTAVLDDRSCDQALINGVPPGRKGALAKAADRLLGGMFGTQRNAA